MPNIGGKKFPYTPAGRRAASSYARRTGQPMSNAGGYGGGNPGMRRPISRGGGYGMRNPMPSPAGGGYGMRGPGALAGLRSPRAPMRRNRMNPLAMLGMMRKRNIV
tara:strand:+ start:387 stop:704 length:318 start_codon:yes stop_codon:yes gene_type:complete